MRNRLLGLMAGGLLLSLAACASNGAAKADQQPTAQVEGDRSELEQQIAQQASGSQPGKIKDVEDDELVLAPYSATAGEATLALEESTPVFRGGERISMSPEDALESGADVNVYYQARGGETPLVLGVRILEPEEAQQLMAQFGVGGAGEQEQEQEQQEQEKPEEFARAEGMQAGKVQQITEDELVLDPYEEGAEIARLEIGDEVKVMRNGVELSRDALTEGEDVRVFFNERGEDPPEVIGVEILTSEEAEELQ